MESALKDIYSRYFRGNKRKEILREINKNMRVEGANISGADEGNQDSAKLLRTSSRRILKRENPVRGMESVRPEVALLRRWFVPP